MKTPSTLLLALLAAPLLLASCRKAAPPATAPAATAAPPRVFVTNYPLYYLAGRLGGDAFTVVFPMKEPGDPAFWEPDAATVAGYQKADLILLNGAGFEAWTAKVSLPERKLVDTGARFKGELLASGEAVTHSHGLQGEHTHPALDFTTWLEPRLALQQADAVAAALTRLRPAEAGAISTRLAALKADWLAWQADLTTLVAPRRDLPVLASHPVYHYLQRAGGLNWRSVHWEPDETPSAEEWAKLAELLKSHPARWMVWEAEPLPAVRERLKKDFGIDCVVFDPAGNRPARGDLLEVMRANLAGLRRIYAP